MISGSKKARKSLRVLEISKAWRMGKCKKWEKKKGGCLKDFSTERTHDPSYTHVGRVDLIVSFQISQSNCPDQVESHYFFINDPNWANWNDYSGTYTVSWWLLTQWRHMARKWWWCLERWLLKVISSKS